LLGGRLCRRQVKLIQDGHGLIDTPTLCLYALPANELGSPIRNLLHLTKPMDGGSQFKDRRRTYLHCTDPLLGADAAKLTEHAQLRGSLIIAQPEHTIWHPIDSPMLDVLTNTMQGLRAVQSVIQPARIGTIVMITERQATLHSSLIQEIKDLLESNPPHNLAASGSEHLGYEFI
jgi:hypothetical protein